MASHFDHISRLLASPIRRRDVFKLSIGLAGAGLLSLVAPRTVRAGGVLPAFPMGGMIPSVGCVPFNPASGGFGCPNIGGMCTNGQCPGVGQLPCNFCNCCPPSTVCCGPMCCGTQPECCFAQAGGKTMYGCCAAGLVCCNDHNGNCCPTKWSCCVFKGNPICCEYMCNPSTPTGCCPGPTGDPQSAYYFSLGGTFLGPTKSVPGCVLCGNGQSANSNSVTATSVMGELEDYDFASRTLIGPVTFDDLQGEVSSDGDADVMAMGSGPVNGVPTNILLMASQTAGVVTYSLFNADTMQELSGGTGEPDSSTFELTITLPS
jgi:hypothetical protein